ncbi:D-Ala-D-Ala carboxypeptidase family metallohydrolase [Pseudomonas fontis]|uniref:D-Ala-D-Ala carboxypeptidase family metallohydrolase n=1 Tax=Pseudomonas fontis TaxID=2942633 RepID=A0ABT5NVY4_9PSED|nr:D-Ala-D-Ala carboxypeptidase family metallohydrolase [Pseudomonas fontis]MDD0976854.1 D-Ala-D-Ala carboxypeptidase family metallohydrolase [Pseudomonas fontis]MDD0992336.1 D-Ala-D-Ala carboxypeptidase family metallohydrolase [Pseudomonas fontis]
MYLSPHFTLDEMIVSQTASREGIDNTPSPQVVRNLRRLTQTLEQVRSLVGCPIVVSSGYRSLALNRRIGGSSTSAHIKGLAADISAVRFSARELAQRLASSDLVFDQMIYEYDGWVHFGLAEHGARQQVLTLRQGTGYLPGVQ